jgi:uncharacterized protein YkwD
LFLPSLRAARNWFVWSLAGLLIATSGALFTAEEAHPAEIVDPVQTEEGAYSFKPPEKCMMRKINRARARHGLRKLKWDPQLAYVARRHAGSIATARGVYHDYRVGEKVTNWRRLAQNTGRGMRCKPLFRAFMRSSKHKSNILGTWYFMGVGAQRAGGRLYVQQLFESRYNPGNIYHYP